MSLLDIFKIKYFKQTIEDLNEENSKLKNRLTELHADEYYEVQEKVDNLKKEISSLEIEKENQEKYVKLEIERCEAAKQNALNNYNQLLNEIKHSNETFEKKQRQIARSKELYKSIDYSIKNYYKDERFNRDYILPDVDTEELELISPSVILKLNCMDIKDLRKSYRDNDKLINKVLTQYSDRYTTKANKTIYNLMVLALRSELQNILLDLKYEKLDKAIENVKKMTAKYLELAANGNQNIAGTLTRFIGEIEYLFINAVKIEYNYYVKKEQARQEQLAIRQQMREEAQERKALAEQQAKVEKEEQKYTNEITKLENQLTETSNPSEIELLKQKILELQVQLSDVIIKKEEITKLQNGKAGNVYVISNLGSFGDNIFKIGMTRRLDPQERIDELGSASVPFKFDVHSFIFSENAVDLENKLHQILNEKRVNKVNLRKEFFKVDIEELENIITNIDPTAAFNKTMLATEFRQSLSTDKIYTNEYNLEDFDDEDEEE